jgi:Raf kinase inhibitor-like YbhB/YbcL family protein
MVPGPVAAFKEKEKKFKDQEYRVLSMHPLIVQLPFSVLPPEYTCDGANHSPPIRVKNLLPKVQSLAVMAFHPQEPGCSFCSWLIWNLPPLEAIPEGFPPIRELQSPIPGLQGENDYKKVGYAGPCPPQGGMARVLYRVYGLDDMLALEGGSTKHALIAVMRGHVLQFGETIAMYQR